MADRYSVCARVPTLSEGVDFYCLYSNQPPLQLPRGLGELLGTGLVYLERSLLLEVIEWRDQDQNFTLCLLVSSPLGFRAHFQSDTDHDVGSRNG